MTTPQPQPPADLTVQDLAAVLDWWRLAGVNCSYRAQPQSWLGEIEPSVEQPPAGETMPARQGVTQAAKEQPGQTGGERASWPTDLPSFREWWLAEPSLAERGAFLRIAPVGEAEAEIMLLLPMPEEGDRDTLLSGADGQMARHLLRAMGVAPAAAYLATVLPRHMPLPDWKALAAGGIADVARHHITLVQPRRVLVLGRSLRDLFTKEDAVLCGPGLEELRRSAKRREQFWTRWLEWDGRTDETNW